jgi:hypothetical protein
MRWLGQSESTEPNRANTLNRLVKLERVEGIEPSTRSLGSYCSTTELHPPDSLAHFSGDLDITGAILQKGTLQKARLPAT